MDKLGVAVVGCGGIAQVHLSLLALMPTAKICAVCDIVPERSERAAREYGAQAYRDYREAIARPDVDVVHLCTPHYLHAPMTLDALALGKRVLTEKPMASEVEDALAMIAADDGRLGVVFQNRYNPSVQIARAIAQDGSMGELTALRGFVAWKRLAPYYTESGWRGAKKTEGGGVLINQSIHTLDLMLWLGGTPERVSGAVSTDALDGVIEVEDSAHFTVQFANGRRGVFYATTAHSYDAPIELELTLEKGTLLIVGDRLIRRDASGERALYVPERPAQGEKAYWGSGHGALLQDYYDAAIDDRPFWIDGEEGLPALMTLKSVYRSSQERRPVRIDEWRRD